jgi:hypothetical protein
VFDPLRLRTTLWAQAEAGAATILCKSCSTARVIWIQPKGSRVEPDWDLWGRLLQWSGSPGAGVKWRVFWIPADVNRELPPPGTPVGAEHLNGGYCYPCSPHVIMIYRKEEAARVLAHELLHAACTDPPGAPLPIKEATTETWAELLLVAVCSKGSSSEAKRLWKTQASWIASQNTLLETYYGVSSPNDYAWRYTVGRGLILTTLKISLPPPTVPKTRSSRLTAPELCM